MDAETYPQTLFSRQQIAAITGIDSSTLNYWMRESVLRPAEGGSGRGSHRKFAYHQATLGGLLYELRKFGIAMPALARLAARFHEAIDWMEQRGIDRGNMDRIHEAWRIRSEYVTCGNVSQELNWGVEAAQYPDHRVHRHEASGAEWVELEWDRAIADVRTLWTARGHAPFSQEEIDMLSLWDRDDVRDFGRHRPYVETVTRITRRPRRRRLNDRSTLFFRTDDGAWELVAEEPEDDTNLGFIGIDVEALTSRMWRSHLEECPAQGALDVETAS